MSQQTDSRSSGTDSQAGSNEPTTFFSRRRLIKGAAGATGAAALGGAGLWYGSRPALAAKTFQESSGEVTVVANSGEVEDVLVTPVFDLNWSNFGGGVTDFDFTIKAAVDGGSTETVYDATGVTKSTSDTTLVQSVSGDGLSKYEGTATVDCTQQSIIDGSTITTSSFPEDVPQGTTETATVTLTLSATGTTGFGSSVSSGDATRSFDVTVDNPDGTLTVSLDESNAEATGTNNSTEANAN